MEEYAEHALMSIEQGQGARIHTIKKTEVIGIVQIVYYHLGLLFVGLHLRKEDDEGNNEQYQDTKNLAHKSSVCFQVCQGIGQDTHTHSQV